MKINFHDINIHMDALLERFNYEIEFHNIFRKVVFFWAVNFQKKRLELSFKISWYFT